MGNRLDDSRPCDGAGIVCLALLCYLRFRSGVKRAMHGIASKLAALTIRLRRAIAPERGGKPDL